MHIWRFPNVTRFTWVFSPSLISVMVLMDLVRLSKLLCRLSRCSIVSSSGIDDGASERHDGMVRVGSTIGTGDMKAVNLSNRGCGKRFLFVE